MEIRKGERWRCQNPACHSEILVVASSQVTNGKNPRCSCGSPMKKPYVRPEVKTLRPTEEMKHDFGPHTVLCLDLYAAKRTPRDRV